MGEIHNPVEEQTVQSLVETGPDLPSLEKAKEALSELIRQVVE